MTKTKQTIIINGRRFDAATGLPISAPSKHVRAAVKKTIVIKDVASPPAKPSTPRTAAPHAKSNVQKSITLRRSALKKPAGSRPARAHRLSQKIERSPHISRFAPSQNSAHPEAALQPKAQDVDPELAQQAAALQNAHTEHLKKMDEIKNKPAISSRTIKDHLLKQQLEKAPLEIPHQAYQAGAMSTRARFMSMATTSLAVILLGGYLTYINIPNLSIRVAAANAGVDATLPRYQPNGYRLQGPITYTEGQVSVNYQHSDGNAGYRIVQKSSDWDPQATLDNYVKPISDGNYQIHSSQGLTVYTYNNKAAWVNGGILHVIEATAPLSGQQVERIAVSM